MYDESMSEQELREIAKKRIEAKQGFKIHLAVYVLVNLGLWAIYFFITKQYDGYAWPIYPLLGWGIGVAAHFFAMMNELKQTNSNIIDKEIEKIKSGKMF